MADLNDAIAAVSNEKKATWREAKDLKNSYPAWMDLDLSVLQANISTQIIACTSLEELRTATDELFRDVAKIAYINAQAVKFILNYLKGYEL